MYDKWYIDEYLIIKHGIESELIGFMQLIIIRKIRTKNSSIVKFINIITRFESI